MWHNALPATVATPRGLEISPPLIACSNEVPAHDLANHGPGTPISVAAAFRAPFSAMTAAIAFRTSPADLVSIVSNFMEFLSLSVAAVAEAAFPRPALPASRESARPAVDAVVSHARAVLDEDVAVEIIRRIQSPRPRISATAFGQASTRSSMTGNI